MAVYALTEQSNDNARPELKSKEGGREEGGLLASCQVQYLQPQAYWTGTKRKVITRSAMKDTKRHRSFQAIFVTQGKPAQPLLTLRLSSPRPAGFQNKKMMSNYSANSTPRLKSNSFR